MRIPCLTRTALIGVISLCASGCSFLFVQGPPAGHEQMRVVSCTDSKTLPLLDAIWAGASALDLILYATDEGYGGRDRGAGIAESAARALIWGIAASKGYKKVRECRAAKELWARRIGGQGPDELGPQLVPVEPSEPLEGPLPRRQH